MQYWQRELEKTEFQEFVDELQHRRKIIKKLGFDGLPNCFDYGQRVGFFYGKAQLDANVDAAAQVMTECGYSFGTLITSDERTASVLSDCGKSYVVSPFSLFPIK
ncbi:MAG: hypothetical protein KDD38_04630 [Bdellovibrionales bacterium]|nr:hypothetical protein [Bdellovibrionales bacterium]